MTGQKPEKKEDSNLITVKAQMIGTFYRSSAPDKPPFIEVGSVIKPGDTLCIIEGRKLFNEIESEISGKVVKTINNGQQQAGAHTLYIDGNDFAEGVYYYTFTVGAEKITKRMVIAK